MKKVVVSLFILIFSGSFYSQSSGEQANELKSEQKAKSEENLIISSAQLDFSKHKVTFIELGADRCIPCKAMQPIMREIAEEYAGKIQVVFYDVWKDPNSGRKYGIQLIPTQVFIDKNGDEIFRHVGFYAKDEIIKMLKEKGIL